tara:strand:- start:761 stop:1210 length:450 start_codon:yes stop_codon:yes gene_type:complete
MKPITKIIVSGILAIVSGLLAYEMVVHPVYLRWSSRHWEFSEATVDSIETLRGRNRSVKSYISYSFRRADSLCSGKVLDLYGGTGSLAGSDLIAKGKVIQVRVQPESPHQSIVSRDLEFIHSLIGVVALCFCVLFCTAFTFGLMNAGNR